MKKIYIFIIATMGFIGMANAQGDYEAFTFSQADYLGTARFMGAGGAFGSTGGDFSALCTNPASIGVFKSYESSITPLALSFNYSTASYYGYRTTTQKVKYTLPQLGMVFAGEGNNDDNSWQFAIGYNRIMDYNNAFHTDVEINHSLTDVVLSEIEGSYCGDLYNDAALFWATGLIDTFAHTNNHYYSRFGNGALIDQDAYVVRSGGIDEMVFSFGGSFSDKVYIGGTIGLPILHFKEMVSYSESPAFVDDLYGVKDYTLYSEHQDKGTGINAKLGIIYQPANFVRIGASFHSPTYYWKIKDNFSREITTSYAPRTGIPNITNGYSYDSRFALTTPLKANFSTTFLILMRAFIAAEYEFQNYKMATMYSDDYDYSSENEAIRTKYGPSHSFRVGSEVLVTENFALRAGYRYKTTPYKSSESPYKNTTQYISGGLGFRGDTFFADLAYVYRMNKDAFWLYDPAGGPCNVTTKSHNVVVSIGFKF